MNRETIIAIGFGIGLGALVGAVVLFQTNKAEETKVIPIARESDQKKAVSVQSPTNPAKIYLTLDAPQNGAIVSKKTIEITGSAQKNSLIVAQSPINEIVEKIEDKAFKIEMPLAIGENIIQVSAYSDSSAPQEQTLRVYYIPQE